MRSRVPHSSSSRAITRRASHSLPLRLRSGPLDCRSSHSTIPAHWSLLNLPFLPTCIIHSLILRPDPARHNFLAGVPSNSCLALRCHKKQCGILALDHNFPFLALDQGNLWWRTILFCRRLESDRAQCAGPGRQTLRQKNLLIVSLDRIP